MGNSWSGRITLDHRLIVDHIEWMEGTDHKFQATQGGLAAKRDGWLGRTDRVNLGGRGDLRGGAFGWILRVPGCAWTY